MSFLELVKQRQSIRSYKSDPVEKEKLDHVLEAARLAPSACNFQPWKFIVLHGPEVTGLSACYEREWFLKAPTVIVVCVDHDVCWKRADGKDYGAVDAAIAMDHIVLAAAELGLGTCWIGAFNEKELRKALKLPRHIEPVVMTPLGYPETTPDARGRKEKAEVVCYGEWRD